MSDTKYIFENENVYAIREGKVVASATNLSDLEEKLANPMIEDGNPNGPFGAPISPTPHPDDPMQQQGQLVPCPGCGAEVPGQDEVCPHCGTPLAGPPQGGGAPGGMPGGPIADPMMPAQPMQMPPGVAHVVTPNGLKGKVLARTPDLWGETVTVRLENGRIAHLPVSKVAAAPVEKTAGIEKTAAEQLEDRLDSTVEGDRGSLEARLTELEEIRHEARLLDSAQKTASIVVAADLEAREVKLALDHVDDLAAQTFQAPNAYSVEAAPDSSAFGLTTDGWLDNTVSEMVAEAEGQDFDRIIEEEAPLFVSDLNDGAVADMGATREMALSHIRPKIAGLDRDIASEIESRFLERVEAHRRAAHVARKQASHEETAIKQAAVINLPDDVLFGL